MNFPYFQCAIKFADEPDRVIDGVIIALTEDLGEDADGDADVFYYAGDYPEDHIRALYSESAWKAGKSCVEWYIVSDDGEVQP